MLVDRERQFWERWYAEDYSWNGLKAKSLGDGRTLQDYWAEEKERGLLIEAPDGREYTRFHLPFVLRGGEATSKNAMSLEEQEALEDALKEKVREAGRDGSVLALDGVVIPNAITISGIEFEDHQPIKISFGDAWLRKLAIIKMKLASFASDHSFYADGFHFEEVEVEGRINFWRSAIAGRNLMKMVSAGDPVQLGETYFDEWLVLNSCHFKKAFWSWRAHFARDFRCENCTFGEDSDEKKEDDAKYRPCITFGAAHFSALASFTDCQFKEATTFRAAVFEQDAVFNGVKWPAHFDDSVEAFAGAAMSGNAYFKGNEFFAFAAFAGANFEREVSLSDDAILSDDRFRAALCQAMSDDECVEAYRKEIAKEQEERGIEGKGRTQAKLTVERERLRTALSRGDAPGESGRTYYEPSLRELEKPRAKPPKEYEREFFDPRLRALEAGLRAVRKSAAEVRDISMAQRFFRFELLTRRKRVKRLIGGAGFFFTAYRRLSDFGSSFTRPILSLFILWLLAAVIFLFVGAAFVPDVALASDAPSALEFSARNIFRPTSVWSARDFHGEETFSYRLLFESGNLVRLAVRAIASFQSVLSGVLIFLFALAARRQFELR